MKGSEVVLSLVIGAVLFSLTRLHSTSTLFSSSTNTDASGTAQQPSSASTWEQPTEAMLQKDVDSLLSIKQMLELSIEELKLSHENAARLTALQVAHNMIADKRSSLSKPPHHQASPQSSPLREPSAVNWCEQAAKLFKLEEPVHIRQQWGLMQETQYQEAWIAHQCDSIVFPSYTSQSPPRHQHLSKTSSVIQAPVKTLVPTSSKEPLKSFIYLNDGTGAPRRQIKVVVWNKIRGFLDWLRPDFVKDAKEKCSTECIFTDNKRELGTAEGVLFHAKTHSMGDFPPRRTKPNQKFMMVSLEQPDYAPLMKQKKYIDKFDYIMTYDLDSTVPIITIHPHYTAQEYYAAPSVPWEKKKDAAVLFTSNCKNAGAESRLKYVQELMKYYDVHSYGRCLKNKEEPPKGSRSPNENKRFVLSQYKWYLAFENNIIKDYVSEKVFDGILAGAVPVYYGTASVDSLLPNPSAVVKVSDYKTPQELAAHLRAVGSDKSKYEAYLKWKTEPSQHEVDAFQRVIDSTGYKYTSLCRICQKLADDNPQ